MPTQPAAAGAQGRQPAGSRYPTFISRKRMNPAEGQILEAEFALNANWSRQKVTELAKRLHLRRAKIYKWNYDRKKREPRLQAVRDAE